MKNGSASPWPLSTMSTSSRPFSLSFLTIEGDGGTLEGGRGGLTGRGRFCFDCMGVCRLDDVDDDGLVTVFVLDWVDL